MAEILTKAPTTAEVTTRLSLPLGGTTLGGEPEQLVYHVHHS